MKKLLFYLQKILKYMIKFITNPVLGFSFIIIKLDNSILYRKIPDSFYLKCQYYFSKSEKLNLKAPVNFNQKIQWLKIYYKNPLYTKLADKYESREYVENKAGNKYLIPLLGGGVFNKFDDIDFSILPKQFVLKCNHDSGSVIICKNKDEFDIENAKNKIEACLKINYCDAYPYREWQYKNIKPIIMIEQYLINSTGEESNDYKFFCFNGEPRVLYVSLIGEGEPFMNYYDLEWNRLDLTTGYKTLRQEIKRPDNLDEMILVCKKLSEDIPFVRIDLYLIDGKIYFGEFTFTPYGGYYPFNPPKWNKIWGDWLRLPEKINTDNY
jgi:hypothetical protein